MNDLETLEVPAELLESARMSLGDLRLEVAVLLFETGKVSLGKAAEFAGMHLGEFLTQLSARGLGIHAGAEEAERDASTIKDLFPTRE